MGPISKGRAEEEGGEGKGEGREEERGIGDRKGKPPNILT